MQENNFEKQVQQKVEELTFDPSGEVWQKVSVAIGKQKNDRHIIAIILLLLLVTSSAIFIISYQNRDKKIAKSFSTEEKLQGKNKVASTSTAANPSITTDTAKITAQNLSKGNKIKSIQEDRAIANKGKIVKASPVARPLMKAGSDVNNKGVDEARTVAPHANKAQENDTNKISYTTRPKVNISITSDNAFGLNDDTVANKDEVKDEAIIPPINVPAIVRQLAIIKNDSVATMELPKTSIAVGGIKGDSIAGNLMKGKPRSNWELGFTFSGGITTTQNSYLGIISLGNADDSKAFSAPTQSTGGTGGATIPRTPSKLTAGLGYHLGVYIQKNISYKTAILIGINYKTYTSAMVTGSPVNNSPIFNTGNISYNSGNTSNYKNKFHFIELPVSARLNVRKQSKLPIYLNAGLSVARLISSNALQFDTVSGIYYSNNAVFNKTPFNVSAGLQFTLPLHAIHPMLIGPDINFSLNKMAKLGLYQHRRYSYFGIRVQKTFGSIGRK
ncbi:MAG: hypothetical protein JWP81_3797 [Ferruginibacter sp.]|nr:hypothetical protein [Ferruginibacter sp.]